MLQILAHEMITAKSLVGFLAPVYHNLIYPLPLIPTNLSLWIVVPPHNPSRRMLALMRGILHPSAHQYVRTAGMPQTNPQHLSNAGQHAERANPWRELFPVSNSRSEFESVSQYPKRRSGEMVEAPLQKRSKYLEVG